MPVTRADVARRAGVSPALVSYVLNSGPRPVSAENRRRVLQAIEELGYRPNRIARALRENRTHSIAMLVPDYVNPHFAELAQAVEDEAFANDYVLLIGTANNEVMRERSYLRSFVDRQVDGLLLISAASSPDIAQISEARIPVVLLDRAPKDSGFSTVVIDNKRASREAVEHLLGHGRRAPAYIGGPRELTAVAERDAGWREALEAAEDTGLPPQVHTAFSPRGGYEAMKTLLLSPEVIDSVFVASDAQAIGALRACSELGCRVPDDIALVAFDGTQAGVYTNPSLTSVVQGIEDIARVAIAELLQRIGQHDSPARHRVVEARLRIGGTCGC
ncbi:LacI family DNA-binding transcriptional regulator [Actinopolymorpha sp. NPDC004070]|uniref:LacI family DNA-binding transcriptional regulator n=1 Tax=Actinopolymorpha sp. NPDC004070 TaxID=3154548 RepID=UPI0033A790BA